jgi:hypothetical protein
MTPLKLYILLGLGVLATVALVVICVAALRIPRTWRAAKQARPGPAAAWITTSGALVWVLWLPAFNARLVDLDEPITCSSECGWVFYYITVIGALRLLAIAGILTAVSFIPALIVAVRTWLDKPVAPDCEDFTNGLRLRRWWRIRRLERDLTRSLEATLGSAGAETSVRVTRQRTVIQPASAITSIRLDPAPAGLDDLAETFTVHPLIDSLDINPDGDQLRVHWNLARVDCLPGYHVLRTRRRRASDLGVTAKVAVVGAVIAVGAAALAVATQHQDSGHATPISVAAFPPASVEARPVRDQLVPFTIGEDACRPSTQTPDVCGPDGHDGQVLSADLGGQWVIHEVGFNPALLVRGRVVTRVRWEFDGPDPTVVEQDLRDPSHSPVLYGDDPDAAVRSAVLVFLRPGGYRTTRVTATVVASAPTTATDLDDESSRHRVLIFGRPSDAAAGERETHCGNASLAPTSGAGMSPDDGVHAAPSIPVAETANHHS